jgi:purine catabolism regulator
VQRLSANQERLASAALREGTPGVLEMLSRTLSADVLLLDGQGRTLDAAGAGAGELEARVAALLDLDQGAPRRASFTHVDDTGHLTVQTLAMPSQRHGYLALASTRPFDANDRLLVGHAVTMVSIALEKPSQVREVEMRLKRGVFRALLRLGQDADMGLTRFFGFTPDSPVGVLVLRDVGPLRAAELAVTERLAEEQAPFLCTNVKDGLAVLLPAAGLAERSRRLYASVRTTLSRSVSGGVGNPVGLAQAADSLRQAATAARVASVQGHVLVRFADLGIFDLLLSTQSRDTLHAIASSVLRPIEEFDSAQRGDLIRSTSEFLMHNGQWEAASAALGVHRHTLRNRIDRVSELLGRDMEAAHTRSEVWLALKAREVLGMDSLLPADDPAGAASDLGDEE